MEYTKLGGTGLDVSRIGLGCMSYGDVDAGGYRWVLDEASSRPFIRDAIEAGVNLFDTANVYSMGSSEEILGRALREFGRRDELVIATKVMGRMGPGPNRAGLSRKAVLNELDASLRRLGVDYIDLYQIHRSDPATPLLETLEALDTAVRSGKVRYIGASSMPAWQLAKALHLQERHGLARFVSMQDHYNLINRETERETLPLCIDERVGVIVYSPLARGRLARAWGASTARSDADAYGREQYARIGVEESDRRIVSALETIAGDRGVRMSVVAQAWVREQPVVDVTLVGATKPHHLADALSSLEITLTSDERAALEADYAPHPQPEY